MGAREARQAAVMEGVELGLMRRMEIWRVDDPVTEGRGRGGEAEVAMV